MVEVFVLVELAPPVVAVGAFAAGVGVAVMVGGCAMIALRVGREALGSRSRSQSGPGSWPSLRSWSWSRSWSRSWSEDAP
jgi:hypothetical protein